MVEPEETFIGTVNEDFAIESMVGDIFQLGNASWRIQQVSSGNGARFRCARRTAHDSVLAWRSPCAE